MGRAEFLPLGTQPSITLWLLERGLTLVAQQQREPRPGPGEGLLEVVQIYQAHGLASSVPETNALFSDLWAYLRTGSRPARPSSVDRDLSGRIADVKIRITIEVPAAELEE